MLQRIELKPHTTNIIEVIEHGDLNEFIKFAKSYNIFQEKNTGKLYKHLCDLIKARLDREGLSHETVRPE